MPANKITFLVSTCILAIGCFGQQNEIDKRLAKGELQMIFPSIYFLNNSTDYAPMPYTVDSCLRYISKNINDISNFAIWRDSSETEKLTQERILKLKTELKKHLRSRNIEIEKVLTKQKVSRQTISMGDEKQQQYLLSLNSVFDITLTGEGSSRKFNWKNHVQLPRPWCGSCWKNGFHVKTRRNMRKVARMNKQRINK